MKLFPILPQLLELSNHSLPASYHLPTSILSLNHSLNNHSNPTSETSSTRQTIILVPLYHVLLTIVMRSRLQHLIRILENLHLPPKIITRNSCNPTFSCQHIFYLIPTISNIIVVQFNRNQIPLTKAISKVQMPSLQYFCPINFSSPIQ